MDDIDTTSSVETVEIDALPSMNTLYPSIECVENVSEYDTQNSDIKGW